MCLTGSQDDAQIATDQNVHGVARRPTRYPAGCSNRLEASDDRLVIACSIISTDGGLRAELSRRRMRRIDMRFREALGACSMIVLVLGGCGGTNGLDEQSATSAVSATSEAEPIETASSITSTMPTEYPSRDELGSALELLGVDVTTAPVSVVSLDDAVLCGVEQQVQGALAENLDETARRCFLDRHMSAQPAVFVEQFPTTEGDPIVTVWRTLADGSVAVDVDSTRDAFGSGAWNSRRCTRMTTSFPAAPDPLPASYFGCADASDTSPPLTTPSAPMPAWFEQRQPLPLCGYEVRLDDEIVAARECFADAAGMSKPAEYAAVSFGDEGERSARWFRSIGDGAFEIFEWQSGGDVGSTMTHSSSVWLRYNCTTIEFLDDGAADLAGIPLLNSNGACSTVEAPSTESGGVDGPVVYADPSEDSEAALAGGTVELVDGCLMLVDDVDAGASPTLVWQAGTRWDPVDSEIVLPDGSRLGIGDKISAGGGFHPVDQLSGFVSNHRHVARPHDADLWPPTRPILLIVDR